MGEIIKLEKECKSVGSQILRTLHALNETGKKILLKKPNSVYQQDAHRFL